MHQPGQLCNMQGSAQNDNVEPLIQKAGKKAFSFLPQFLSRPETGFSFVTSCCNPSARGTPEARADPHRHPGPYPVMQVKFILDVDPPCKRAGPPRGVEGGWLRTCPGTARGACVRTEAPSPRWMLHCPMQLPLQEHSDRSNCEAPEMVLVSIKPEAQSPFLGVEPHAASLVTRPGSQPRTDLRKSSLRGSCRAVTILLPFISHFSLTVPYDSSL